MTQTIKLKTLLEIGKNGSCLPSEKSDYYLERVIQTNQILGLKTDIETIMAFKPYVTEKALTWALLSN
jgi:hypothetical protein